MDYQSAVFEIGKYWDKRAVTFDADHDTENLEEWKTVLNELLGDPCSKTLLDVGVGTGFLSNLLSEMGYSVTGVDISDEMMRYGIRRARMKNVPVFYLHADGAHLPFLDDSIDYIVNARLIWTMPDPEKMLAEWFRVLKPGGKVFCFNRMKEDYGLKRYGEKPLYGDENIHKMLSFESASIHELENTFESLGFENATCKQLSPLLTRKEFHYDRWHVVFASKPMKRSYVEELNMAQYWNDSAQTYDERHDLHDENHWQNVLSGLVGSNKEATILDVATGTGLIANYLASAGYENVVGVDISEKMMAHAIRKSQKRGNDIEFLYGDTLDLPFEDEVFDVVINSRLLWTLSDPLAAMKEWYRVLRPGGTIVAINELEESGIQVNLNGEYSEKTGINEFPFAQASQEEILDVFEQAGFKKTVVRHMEGCHMKTSNSENWFAFIGKK